MPVPRRSPRAPATGSESRPHRHGARPTNCLRLLRRSGGQRMRRPPARAPPRSHLVSRRRTYPRRLHCPRRGWRKSRRPARAFRAAATRRSRARPPRRSLPLSRARQAITVREAAHCRRASSRNAVRAIARRPSSARSRLRVGRRCRPRTSGAKSTGRPRGMQHPSCVPRGARGIRAWGDWGISALPAARHSRDPCCRPGAPRRSRAPMT